MRKEGGSDASSSESQICILLMKHLGSCLDFLTSLPGVFRIQVPFFSSLFPSSCEKVMPALVFPLSCPLDALPFRLYLLRKAYKTSPTR